MAVLIETTLGDLVVDLFVKERPKSCLNFLKLCKMKYYNLCQFHSIEENYIAQTGDPTATGKGGESVYYSIYGEQGKYIEPEDLPKMRHTRKGIVSFVNNGENMLGSQFFVTLGEELDYLDDKHTIFGQVTEGLDTLEKLNEQLTNSDHRPFKDIRISHTIVLDDPFDDLPRLRIPSRSPSPTYEMLVKTDQLALDEKEDENEGKSQEEIEEETRLREMAEQAQILEMVGDLRDADDVPPENVLFVCKLNPVTTDEDLEIIFSRFGKINNCDIIRDRRTNDSLQYAFIEFDNAQSCERAYFKMDNVLIDDRRIHVDFSQSVSGNYKRYRDERRAAKEKALQEKQRSLNNKVKRERSSPTRRIKRERSDSPPRRQIKREAQNSPPPMRKEVKRERDASPPPRRRHSPSPKRDRKDDRRERRDDDRRRHDDRSRRDRSRDRDRHHRDHDDHRRRRSNERRRR
ncbi:unnamed protein product [Caenorhabditis auriculariae]|uniref:Peptidyl-prolyl cis-trans isomerase n=1 Tax=Caenorhabditis auriculariae TaxID=2777116 RepID=A0A8S1HC97_9PELO|nr:unnamed protein product [Caenorhabditis auriculariae]